MTILFIYIFIIEGDLLIFRTGLEKKDRKKYRLLYEINKPKF